MKDALQDLEQQGLLRTRHVIESPQGAVLRVAGREILNFASNDYLGFAAHPGIIAAAQAGLQQYGLGAGASALLCGHNQAVENLEAALADFVRLPRALYFCNGYLANIGIISALAGPGDTVWCDRLSHASLIDGIRLSGARWRVYPHNAVDYLADRLRKNPPKARERIFLVTEGVFSMEGDQAPLPALLALCEQYNGYLLVDDAHGFGICGDGRGSVQAAQLSYPRIIYMATLGKAAGCAGAFVAGSVSMIAWLMQRARTYMFTTANPPMLAVAAQASLNLLKMPEHRQQVFARIAQFQQGWQNPRREISLLPSSTPIQAVVLGDNHQALACAKQLFAQGFWIPAIRPPTVPRGSARLRISLSAAHSPEQITRLLTALHKSLEVCC